MRVVIDTNVWVSGLLWRGPARTVIHLAEQGRVVLFMSPPMLEELTVVLDYTRFQPRLDQLGLRAVDLITHVLGLVTMIDRPASRSRIVMEDPDDDMFLHCATAVGARAVVSGDNHLLSLGCHEGIPIITVREFLSLFSNSGASSEPPAE